MTIEFYLADPKELISLFSEHFYDPPDDLTLFDELDKYPKAEFPGRLLIPDDLDALCQILRKYQPFLPSTFRELFIKQIWSDSQIALTDSLTLLSDQFANVLAELSESEIERAALEWVRTYPLQEPFQETLPYRGVMQLREIACDAIAQKKSLVLYLSGSPGFFDYLRYL
jgi:hypothetical protein